MRALGIIWLSWATVAAAAAPHALIKVLHARIPMRDHVHLSANIFRPAEPAQVPAILVRTPYGKGADITPHYQAYVDRGYAIVIEDVRGRYESEGVFRPLIQEGADGDDTINWIARQPWSDGKVGMMGGSYLGIAQWKVAVLNNPHLKAIFPWVSGDDDYRDRFYSTGGALKLGHRLGWMADNMRVPGYRPDFAKFVLHLPLRTADMAATGQTSEMFQRALDHPDYDSFWKSISSREKLADIKAAVFSVGGWYDNFVESDLEAYMALRKHSQVNRILIGPWAHTLNLKFSNVDYGPQSTVLLRSVQLEWFDQWLKEKDSPLLSKPPVKIFVMGANRWREERQWPLPQTRFTSYYFNSKGNANTLNGDGGLEPRQRRGKMFDTFTYDPRNPVPTRGGSVCCNPKTFPWGPMDQRAVERRADVLVYTTPVLDKDVEVTGPVKVVLYATTSAKDTDFTAKLVDVFPNGEARNLTDGLLRLRYRESLEKAVPANPGEIYRLTIQAGPTSNVFLKGHRIRVEISSSNFPRFDRNPNTGGPIASETRLVRATQTIYHDRRHPSHILLPIVP